MISIQKIMFLANNTAIRSSFLGYEETRKSHQMLYGMLVNMGFRNLYLLDHSIGVASFAMRLSRRLGFPHHQVNLIIKASLLHDIGKLNIPGTLLSKPTFLTAAEYEMVKTHPGLGAALLTEHSDTQALPQIVRHHHERFDGQGYPDHLAGEQIEIETRVVSIADAIDAMRSNRPYRRALSRQQIVNELHKGSQLQFDPFLVEPAILTLKEIGA